MAGPPCDRGDCRSARGEGRSAERLRERDMASRVPMVSLERARELGDAMGMPTRRTQSEAFRVLANNPGVARVAYSQLIQLLENNKFRHATARADDNADRLGDRFCL